MRDSRSAALRQSVSAIPPNATIPVDRLRRTAIRSRVSVGAELAAEMAALAFGRPDHWSTRVEGIQ